MKDIGKIELELQELIKLEIEQNSSLQSFNI